MKPYNVLNWIGGFDAHKHEPYASKYQGYKDGPVRLWILAVVEADTEDDVRRQAYSDMETALDIALLSSGGAVSAPLIIAVYQESLGPGGSDLISTAPVSVWKLECDDDAERVAQALSAMDGDDRKRFTNSLEWTRRAAMEMSNRMRFTFFWFALDALSKMSLFPQNPKPIRCPECDTPLPDCPKGHEAKRIPFNTTKQMIRVSAHSRL